MLSYIGGKSKIAKKLIIPQIPRDIVHYVEPFSGMFWTYYGMNLEEFPNLRNIVYNDTNPLNYNIFLCVKEDPKKLLKICKSFPYQKKGEDFDQRNKDFFVDSQTILYQKNDCEVSYPDYELAARHALVLSNIFSGANPKSSGFIDLKGKHHSKFQSFINKLQSDVWCRKFSRINHVENSDFEKIFEIWDGQKSYFYCDPPYWKVGEGNYYSNHDFKSDDHRRLMNCLKKAEGKFSLSYYDFDELKDWFPPSTYSWSQMEFSKPAMAKKGATQSRATEILIKNY